MLLNWAKFLFVAAPFPTSANYTPTSANFCQLYSNIYQLSPFQTTYNPLSANNITPTLPTFFANSIYSNLYQLSPPPNDT
jgi:hypothetical protein